MSVTVLHGRCENILPTLPDCSVDAVVTDPPYEMGFMGKGWDSTGIAYSVPMWAEVLRVLKPGGHLLSFGGSRTWHRMAVAIEDAGLEVRDSIAWIYGSGFPKSLNVSKAIDKAARGVPQGGVDPTSPNHGKYRTTATEGKRWVGDSGQGYGAGGSRFLVDGAAGFSATGHVESGGAGTAPDEAAWAGWGTALKPAFEPIVVARKPLAGTVAQNVLTWGTGALNIDGCRVGTASGLQRPERRGKGDTGGWADYSQDPGQYGTPDGAGRWPANVILDESQAAALDRQSGELTSGKMLPTHTTAARNTYGQNAAGGYTTMETYGDTGGASRFFYVAKAPKSERPVVDGVSHATVKPLALMRYLVRLVTPPGGTVLDPFAGSGTTGEACILEGFNAILIEREADHIPLIHHRIDRATDALGLFGEETA